jgi:molybdopterin-binding protein
VPQRAKEHQGALALPEVSGELLAVGAAVGLEVEHIVLDLKREPEAAKEPRQGGVDVGAQSVIWDILRDARAAGLGTVLVSADLEELIGLSDRLLVMLRGEIVSVREGVVNAEVVLDLGDGRSLVAGVTLEAARELGLAPGEPALALINAGDILLAAPPAPGEPPLRTSARNDLEGVVSRLETGAVNDEVHVDIGAGKTLVAMVTHASAEALGLAPGTPVRALIKAGHVLLAVG